MKSNWLILHQLHLYHTPESILLLVTNKSPLSLKHIKTRKYGWNVSHYANTDSLYTQGDVFQPFPTRIIPPFYHNKKTYGHFRKTLGKPGWVGSVIRLSLIKPTSRKRTSMILYIVPPLCHHSTASSVVPSVCTMQPALRDSQIAPCHWHQPRRESQQAVDTLETTYPLVN